jgi:hypothetical protein
MLGLNANPAASLLCFYEVSIWSLLSTFHSPCWFFSTIGYNEQIITLNESFHAMDPITALGAAGSVVGIASFGLQLSQTLYQFISSSRGANTSVRAVMDGVNATTGAMDQVRGLLDDENERIAQDGKAVLFSVKALEDIKGIVDQCLIIFWKIEATITNKSDSKFLDQDISRRLVIFNDEVKAKKASKLLKLDSMLVLTKMQCLRWPYVAPKLEQYGVQLNGLQVNLILMFQVVSMRAKTITPWAFHLNRHY